MSNDDNASQWAASPGEPDRGPSFEDPSHPTSPAPPAPASSQDWDRAWGVGDEASQGPGTQSGGANFGQNPPPMQGNGYGPGAQPTPYGAAPGPQGGPYAGDVGQYGGQAPQGQNPYASQYGPQDPHAAPYGAQPGGYQQQPYGSYGGYGGYNYSQPVKSKTTAALLAFFLGGLGIHDFYLGKKSLGLVHLGLVAGGVVLMLVAAIAASASGDPESPLFALVGLGYLVIVGNSIWAFVEFIMILVKPEHELGR